MNKNVLRTMIILCWVFLALYAVLKLVPQLAKDWLDDKDVGGNKTLKYYMYIVK